jgi:hypothetical protein
MWTLTFHNDANFTSTALDICMEGWATTLSLTGISPLCIFEPISTDIISHATQRGGNAFGLSPFDGPLTCTAVPTYPILFKLTHRILVMLVSASWALPSDDEAVLTAAQNIVTSINATAHQLGLGHRYIYQNYASEAQNVFWGYGEENLEKLKAVSKKYDPTGVFENLQPGYFKL